MRVNSMREALLDVSHGYNEMGPFPILVTRPYNLDANGGDRLRQGFGRPTDVMPGFSMQLVKKRREKTIANNNELALAA
jgi:hypothetical protein